MENRDKDIGFYFKRISDCLAASANEHLRTLDITFSQMHVIMFIMSRENRVVRQKDIETCFGLKHPTVVGLVKRMEQKGLVLVEENPSDRRGNLIKALPKAVETADEIRAERERTNEMIVSGLTPEQKSELKDMLSVIYRNMYGEWAEP